jgi:hypothetical protein
MSQVINFTGEGVTATRNGDTVTVNIPGGGGGGGTWGSITGTLSNQTDLQTALNAKQNTITNGNGTTVNGSAVDLGGPLTNIVQIDTLGTYDIDIGDISTGLYFEATSGFIHMVSPYSIFSMGDSDDDGGGLLFTDTRTTKQGIKYFAAGYVTDDRSLTDRGFVASGTVTFTNKSGNISQWTNDSGYLTSISGAWLVASGAALTADNTISGSFKLTHTLNGIVNTQNALSAGWIPSWSSTPGAHTAMTAATEFISNDFKGATQTWIDGTVATQRFNYFRGFTANKTTTSATFTDIYTVYIDKTTAGTGVTITNNWALGVFGKVLFKDTNSITFDPNVGVINWNASANIQTQGLTRLNIAAFGGAVTFSRSSMSSLHSTGFTVNSGVQTSMAANTEVIANAFNGAAWTWAAGTVPTQRFFYIGGWTVNTTTITNAYSLYIDPPTVGTGTITNNWALGLAGSLKLAASTTSMPSFRMVSGVAPTSPTDGDHWFETTNTRLMARRGSATGEILSATAVTSETLVTDTSLTIIFNGTTYKICAKS